jgi:ATP-binding cassette subfamily B protein
MLIVLCILIIDKKLGASDFLVIVNATNQLSQYFIDFAERIPNIKLNSMFIDNLKIVLNFESKLRNDGYNSASRSPTGKELTAIEIKDVEFSYPLSPIETLTAINIKVAVGTKTAIVGENGSGKSTILKLLFRFYDPSNGALFFRGQDYRTIAPEELRKHFAVVLQDFQYYALTIADNVLMRECSGEEDEQLVWEALDMSGLKQKVERLPKKLLTVLTREFDNTGVIFSGGELQKLSIARAYAQNADIIIMDEPTSSLDPKSEDEIFRQMLKLCENKTVIFVSHKLSLCAYADYIYVMEDGQIAEEGTHQQLLDQSGSYSVMYKAQARNYVPSTSL